MKKFMIASLGLSLLSGTAMFAQGQSDTAAGSTESSTMKKKSKKKKSKDAGASGATTSTTATSK